MPAGPDSTSSKWFCQRCSRRMVQQQPCAGHALVVPRRGADVPSAGHLRVEALRVMLARSESINTGAVGPIFGRPERAVSGLFSWYRRPSRCQVIHDVWPPMVSAASPSAPIMTARLGRVRRGEPAGSRPSGHLHHDVAVGEHPHFRRSTPRSAAPSRHHLGGFNHDPAGRDARATVAEIGHERPCVGGVVVGMRTFHPSPLA
jgi:hypothetical protein